MILVTKNNQVIGQFERITDWLLSDEHLTIKREPYSYKCLGVTHNGFNLTVNCKHYKGEVKQGFEDDYARPYAFIAERVAKAYGYTIHRLKDF